MTAPVDHPPASADQPRETPPPAGERRGIEERGWILFVVVLAFLALAFAGMVVLTALGGGTTYVR